MFHSFFEPILVNRSNWEYVKNNLANHPIRRSQFSNLESNIKIESLSLKYVWQGQETYFINQKEHVLGNHQYILVNKQNDCRVFISHLVMSQGICIDIEEKLFYEALQFFSWPNDLETECNDYVRFFQTNELFSQGLSAPKSLTRLLSQLSHSSDTIFTKEFIVLLTQEIIESQSDLITQYNRLQTVKLSTKKELYQRLLKARGLIASNANQQDLMRQIAKEVCLSEFRFHHVFRQAFGLTAHQFHHHCLMEKALDLYKQLGSWTAVADRLHYADLATFSKVFKKKYGICPRDYRF